MTVYKIEGHDDEGELAEVTDAVSEEQAVAIAKEMSYNYTVTVYELQSAQWVEIEV